MDELFEIIRNEPKGNQFNILLELLQEKGASLQILRHQHRHSIEQDSINIVKKEWMNVERIKNKLRELYNENIQDGIPVQNIAQP